MATTLIHKGHSGVTFSIRPDIRYGIRPSPFYEFYGTPDSLNYIYNHLFKCGITASLKKDRLQVAGIKNCVILADILELNNTWSWALQHIFTEGLHKQPNGIRTLFFLFGNQSTSTKEDVDRAIRHKVESRLVKQQHLFANHHWKMRLLPAIDPLYKKYQTAEMLCDLCAAKGVGIYFIGKYPRRGNIFFLCPKCRG